MVKSIRLWYYYFKDNPHKGEDRMQKYEELMHLLMGLGASFAGFSDVRGKTAAGFRDLHYAATIGIRLSDATIDEITDKPTYTYFHHYRTVNAALDQITLRGAMFIQQCGYDAVAVPASQTVNDAEGPYRGIFPHKTAAVMAGLGSIGKNGLFLHREYGPRVRLATILTDMPLASANTIEREQSPCTGCDLCVKACPAIALTGRDWHEGMAREEIVDAKACSDYMNSKFKHIGRGSVCGICIKVCPVRKKHNIMNG
jgi:epoxyqueuosine reductase